MEAFVPRLTKEHIDEIKAELIIWQSPNDMMALVDGTVDRIGASTLFNQAGLEFLRDAWVAAEIARMRQADAVRLVSGPWPDFEIKIQGQIESFEAVEADAPVRRRGKEYRDDNGEAEDTPIQSKEEISQQIEAACRKKVGKSYGAPCNLAIYLNAWAIAVAAGERADLIRSSTRAAADAFTSVWVLWGGRLYRPWPA